MMLRRKLQLMIVVSILPLVVGCALLRRNLCEPGEQARCVCDDGSVGSQICTPDGERFELCQCANMCNGQSVEQACGLFVGVCAGLDPVCAPAGWQCSFPAARQPSETRCDGLDNDCDGEVDEADDLPDEPAHCGSCATACKPGEICRNRACVTGP